MDLIKLNPAQEERGSVVVLVQEDHLHQSSKVGTKLGVNSAQFSEREPHKIGSVVVLVQEHLLHTTHTHHTTPHTHTHTNAHTHHTAQQT